jgi:hypothetical protein
MPYEWIDLYHVYIYGGIWILTSNYWYYNSIWNLTSNYWYTPPRIYLDFPLVRSIKYIQTHTPYTIKYSIQ